MDAEMGVMHLQTKIRQIAQNHRELEEAGRSLPASLWKEPSHADTLSLDFHSPEL